MDTNEATIQRTYEVTWSMIYTADSAKEAVQIALRDLATVLRSPADGPNFFMVTCGDDDPVIVSADEFDDSID